MSVGLTELGSQEGLDEVPSHRRSYCSATHADNVHVIVLDPLAGREMIVDQRSTDARDLVGTHRCPDTAAADRYAAFDLPCRDGVAEWGYKVRIVVVRAQTVRTEIDDLMASRTKLRDQFLLQAEPAVIGGNTDAHFVVSSDDLLPVVLSLTRRRSRKFLEFAVMADQRIRRTIMAQVGLCVAFEFGDDVQGQHLAQFDAPLIERIDVPDCALGEDAVLVEGDELAERRRC